jgi:hypothetical protein
MKRHNGAHVNADSPSFTPFGLPLAQPPPTDPHPPNAVRAPPAPRHRGRPAARANGPAFCSPWPPAWPGSARGWMCRPQRRRRAGPRCSTVVRRRGRDLRPALPACRTRSLLRRVEHRRAGPRLRFQGATGPELVEYLSFSITIGVSFAASNVGSPPAHALARAGAHCGQPLLQRVGAGRRRRRGHGRAIAWRIVEVACYWQTTPLVAHSPMVFAGALPRAASRSRAHKRDINKHLPTHTVIG